MKEWVSVLISLSLDIFGFDGGSMYSRCSTDSKCSPFSSSSAADEDVLGNDISVGSPFLGCISGQGQIRIEHSSLQKDFPDLAH
jgi:hypothetical protein